MALRDATRRDARWRATRRDDARGFIDDGRSPCARAAPNAHRETRDGGKGGRAKHPATVRVSAAIELNDAIATRRLGERDGDGRAREGDARGVSARNGDTQSCDWRGR